MCERRIVFRYRCQLVLRRIWFLVTGYIGKTMRNVFRLLLILVAVLSVSDGQLAAAGRNYPKGRKSDIQIVWNVPEKVTRGGYPRVHRLNDGRIIFACNYRPMNMDSQATGDDKYASSVFPFTTTRLSSAK